MVGLESSRVKTYVLTNYAQPEHGTFNKRVKFQFEHGMFIK